MNKNVITALQDCHSFAVPWASQGSDAVPWAFQKPILLPSGLRFAVLRSVPWAAELIFSMSSGGHHFPVTPAGVSGFELCSDKCVLDVSLGSII